MNFNNSVGDMFECWTCRELYHSMWGVTCNKCREEEKRHRELIDAIKSRNL